MVDIILLEVLKEKSRHGYDIKKVIADKNFLLEKINFGSIYYALKKNMELGFVKQTDKNRENNKPDQLIYSITKNGEKHLEKLRLRYMKENTISFSIDGASLLFDDLESEHRAEVISERTEYVENLLKRIKSSGQDTIITKYATAHLQAELKFLKSL